MHFKRTAAIIMAFTMMASSFNASMVLADEVTETNGTAEDVSEIQKLESTEQTEQSEITSQAENNDDEAYSIENIVQSDFKVSYVISDDSGTLDENNHTIVVGYTGECPEKAILNLKNKKTSEVVYVNASKISSLGLLFDITGNFDDYEIVDVTIYNNDVPTKIDMTKMGLDYDKPDVYIEEDDIQVDTYSNLAKSANGKYVVVLDPGHDDTHGGSAENGISEKDVNLKIATYCKQELEKYYGVQVYMTRSTSGCPYPGTTSQDDNAKRVEFAKGVGADAYVSFHCNSSENSSAKGAEVYYPNADYNSNISNAGADLSQKILNNLASLGLNNRGIKIRNSEDNTLYPDGSLADYYGIIRRSKLAGFPGIIIEHAFVTNPSDALFLGNETNQQKMGVADALGIAQYFGLSKNGVGITDVSFKQENDFTTINVEAFSSYGNLNYTYQVCDTTTGQWLTLADNQSQSSIQWKPEKKKYDIHVVATAPNGSAKDWWCVYNSDVDYTRPYVKLNGIIPMETKDGINVGVSYISNDKTVEFEWLSYNTKSQQWGTIEKWNGSNWITWKPNHGTYLILVKAKVSDGKEVSQNIGYAVDNDYTNDYVNIIGTPWVMHKHSIDLGIAYKHKGSDVSFKWKAYNLTTHKWTIISDWYNRNWVTWRPEQGDYWVYSSAMTHDGATDDKTYCFHVGSDMSYTPISIDGLTWKYNKHSIDIGAAYSTDDNNAKFKWQSFNLDTHEWNTISDWYSGNWATWKPEAGNYWLHVEAKNSDGGYAEKTICFFVGKDYSKHYIDLNGIAIVDKLSYFQVGVNYSTDDSNVKFRWLQYDLIKNEWSSISEWYNGNWAEWNPSNGNYWIYVEAVTSDGVISSMSYGYTVTARYKIMGQSSTNIDQMVRYYNKNANYPTFYSYTDAPNIETFCQIYDRECRKEGIKTEVAFCQAMKETNFLKFGGDVNISQYNFAGIGATGGIPGNAYACVTQGIQAQVQHLKAYASAEPLNQVCVDNRFGYVKRNSVQYVELLGGKWAADKNYGYSIIKDYIANLLYR